VKLHFSVTASCFLLAYHYERPPKVKRVIKPARKARMGRNPFTGEEVKIAAKPKSKAVKCLALASLKKTIG
jgi:hypothetical protein